MYFTYRGIEELEKRHGEEEVTYEWLAKKTRARYDISRCGGVKSQVESPHRSSPASCAPDQPRCAVRPKRPSQLA
ncbi:hypothetical protein GCM10018966_041550 [Streptomyces yanii]